MSQNLASVIISANRRIDTILAIVDGVLNNEPPPEVLLISDGEEETGRLVEKERPQVKVFYTPDILELQTNNLGLRNATGDFLCIVQDDCLIEHPNWINLMIRQFDGLPELAILGGDRGVMVYPRDIKLDPEVELYVSTRSKDEVLGVVMSDKPGRVIKTTTALRGPLMFRGSIIRSYNFLDEVYNPLFFDDMDLCMRARQDGLEVGVTKIQLKHPWGGSGIIRRSAEGKGWGDFYWRNCSIFYQRWGHLLDPKAKPEELLIGED